MVRGWANGRMTGYGWSPFAFEKRKNITTRIMLETTNQTIVNTTVKIPEKTFFFIPMRMPGTNNNSE